MKKLKLRALELGASEILSREQMKKVLGGDDGSGGTGGTGSTGTTDLCAGKSSIVYCKDSSYNILNGDGASGTG